jgi:vacuolar-type H+-ATPase subunit F/Vma7
MTIAIAGSLDDAIGFALAGVSHTVWEDEDGAASSLATLLAPESGVAVILLSARAARSIDLSALPAGGPLVLVMPDAPVAADAGGATRQACLETQGDSARGAALQGCKAGP